jgi:hypothetical protein
MTKDYITEYSYGQLKVSTWLRQDFGGSMSHWVKTVKCMSLVRESLKGKQPIMWRECQLIGRPTYCCGTAYIGIVVFFGNYSFVYWRTKNKVRISFRAITALVLSWEKFPALTDFFIDYVPMYNKFRAVSSIQVILELCFPVLAIMGLQSFLNW